MKNAWTEKIERLEAEKRVLLEACRDAICLRALVEKLEWLKRHEDDLRADFNEGSIKEQEKQISSILGNISIAIAQAERKEP